MSKNSVLDGLRSNLLEFIQESMSEKVLESISSEEVKFEGVKEKALHADPYSFHVVHQSALATNSNRCTVFIYP